MSDGSGIRILAFKPIEGKFIKGELDVVLVKTRLRIPKCTYREDREGNVSVALPERRIKDGENFKYEPILEFLDDSAKRAFSAQAVRALHEFMEQRAHQTFGGGDDF